VLLTSSGYDSDNNDNESFKDRFLTSLKDLNSNLISPIFARQRRNSNDMRIEDLKADIEASVKNISP
jgi:hypothetical protein